MIKRIYIFPSLLITLLALFLSSSFVFCAPITDVKIHGLKRTKESYIMQTLEKFKGADDSTLDTKTVENAMYAYGLFSEVHSSIISNGSGGATLSVTVKEKVSFLPIPIAGANGDGWMAGLMLMDMNAFGKQDILVAGGIAGPDMQMGMLSFTKPPRSILRPGFTLGGSFINSTDVEYTDFDNNTFAKDDNVKAGGNAALILPLSRYFTAALGGDYEFCHFDDGTWDTGHLLLSTARVNWHTSKANDWFTIEQGAAIKGRFGADLGDDGKGMQEVSALARFQLPVTGRARLAVSLSGILQHNIRVPFQAAKRDVGSSIIVGDFHSERIASSRALFETGIVRGKYAMLSMYGSFEGVIADDASSGNHTLVWAAGPGLGALVYLKRVIFPAIMGGVSYNINQNRFLGSFSVGMTF